MNRRDGNVFGYYADYFTVTETSSRLSYSCRNKIHVGLSYSCRSRIHIGLSYSCRSRIQVFYSYKQDLDYLTFDGTGSSIFQQHTCRGIQSKYWKNKQKQTVISSLLVDFYNSVLLKFKAFIVAVSFSLQSTTPGEATTAIGAFAMLSRMRSSLMMSVTVTVTVSTSTPTTATTWKNPTQNATPTIQFVCSPVRARRTRASVRGAL